MKKWGAISQLVTNLGVIIGLVIVVYEIRETRELTQVQLASEAYALNATSNALVAGESLPESLARACFNPMELTEQDTVILFAYYRDLWNAVNRMLYIESFGFDVPVEEFIRGQATLITSTLAGVEWYKVERTSLEDRVRFIADEVGLNANGRLCSTYLGALRSYQMLDAN